MSVPDIVIEDRWYCDYCWATFDEYVNGCPKCYLGEAGTSTSVVCAKCVLTHDGWRPATDAEIRNVEKKDEFRFDKAN